MTIVGIDPGVSGAIAILNNKGKCEIIDTPVMDALISRSVRTVYDLDGMISVLRKLTDDSYIVIERAQPMAPKARIVKCFKCHTQFPVAGMEGSVSMFGYGKGYGFWIGIIRTLGIPYCEVSPASWKKYVIGERKKNQTDLKQLSIDRARELYPQIEFPLKKHHNRAEALLIAHFGVMTKGW